MPNPQMPQFINPAAMGGFQQVRIPSEEERREIKRVQGLQVRTNAADMATKLLAGKDPTMAKWTSVAKTIELYITTDDSRDAGPARI